MTKYLSVFKDIYDELCTIDVIDVHTHIEWEYPRDFSMTNVVFYHFLRYELEACGMPLFPGMGNDDPKKRIREALPYFARIKNTGTHWALQTILKDLYGMKEDFLTEKNLDALFEQFSANVQDMNWPREVLLKKARIKKTAINLLEYPEWASKRDAGAEDWKRYSDIFFPTFEQGVFVFGTVESMHNKIVERTGSGFSDAESLAEALRRYMTSSELQVIKVFLAWTTVKFYYRDVSINEVDMVVKKALRGNATNHEETNIVHVFAMRTLLDLLKDYDIVVQLFFGSELTPKRRAPCTSAYDTRVLNSCTDLFLDYPDQRFELLLGSTALSQEANMIAKMLPNVGLSGVWWHNMYPRYLNQLIQERLDTVPYWKVCGFFSDAYRAEWSYGKLQLVRREMASVFAERVLQGRVGRAEITEIARHWLYENPMRVYKLEI